MLKIAIIICIAAVTRAHFESKLGVILTEHEKIRLSYNEWRVCYAYDLNEFYEEITVFKKCIDKMEVICNQLKENHNCNILRSHLSREYLKMQNDNLNLDQNPQSKFTRSAPLPIVGKITNVLFGIMDEESAENYNLKLNEISSRVNEHNDFISEQTTIIKKALTTTSDTLNEFKSKMFKIANDLKSTNNVTNENTLRIEINFLAETAILIILEHKDIHNSLKSILRETVTGDISDLIQVNTLKNDFNLIREKLTSDESFPINLNKDNINNIFVFCKIRAGIKTNRLFIELSVPTVENKIFTVYEMTPIPMTSKNDLHMIKIKTNQILVNFESREVIEFNKHECKGNGNTGRVCITHSPIILSSSGNCEASLLLSNKNEIDKNCETKIIPKTNYIIQISDTNSYFIFPFTKISAKIICGGNNVETIEIHEPKIIEMSQNCTISLLNMKLRSHNIQSLQQIKVVDTMLDLNNIKFEENADARNFTLSNEAIIMNDPSDFEEIINSLDNLKSRVENSKKINNVEQKSNWIVYGLIALVILVIFLMIFMVYVYYS